jgi:ferrochelatase
MNKKALIISNIGTPDSYETADVRKYLFQFLNDKRVIDLPWLLRKILVNLIIVPFRAPRSAKIYRLLWDKKGSPLLYLTKELQDKLQNILNEEYDVFTAMRYGNPNLKDVLQKIKDKNYESIKILPMFPQYASSTTGSLAEYAMKIIKDWYVIPEIHIIEQFYENEEFIDAFISNIKKFDIDKYDHIIFSYHGLPLTQVNACHPKIDESTCSCHTSMPQHGSFCYKATCYATTRSIVKKLKLKEENFSVGFQSRLTKNWLKPFTDQIIEEKASKGCKNILIIAPSFVTDCLETTVELGIEYDELFKANGGEKLTLVPSLNTTDNWVEAIVKIVK